MRRARCALAALRAAHAAQRSEACAFDTQRTICAAARSLSPPCSQLSAARAAREAEFRARSQLRRWSSTQRAPAVDGAAVAGCFCFCSLTRATQAGCPLRCARAWRSCGSATTTCPSRCRPTCARLTRRTPRPCRRPPDTRPCAAAAASAGADRDHQQGAGAAEPRDGRLRRSEQAGRRESAACEPLWQQPAHRARPARRRWRRWRRWWPQRATTPRCAPLRKRHDPHAAHARFMCCVCVADAHTPDSSRNALRWVRRCHLRQRSWR